jgi:hypothetical protein
LARWVRSTRDTPDAGGAVCPQVMLTSSAVTTTGRATGDNLTFGPDDSAWASFSYVGPGEATPTIAVTPDGNGFEMSATLAPPLASNNYSGFGLYFNSGSCLDASDRTGIQLDLSGDLGTCSLRYILLFSKDLSHIDDPVRGDCPNDDSVCLGPFVPLTLGASTIRIPFTSLTGGAPIATVDPTSLVIMQWQISASDAAAGCTADFTVKNVSFY